VPSEKKKMDQSLEEFAEPSGQILDERAALLKGTGTEDELLPGYAII
jgi:hypothetical protein